MDSSDVHDYTTKPMRPEIVAYRQTSRALASERMRYAAILRASDNDDDRACTIRAIRSLNDTLAELHQFMRQAGRARII